MSTPSLSYPRMPDPGCALQRKRWFIGLLAIVWLVGSGWLLFQLQTAGQRMFDPSLMQTPDYPTGAVVETLQRILPDTGTPLVIHVWDDRCDCAAAAWSHLVSMKDRILAAGAQVVFLARPGDRERAEAASLALSLESGIPVAGVVVDEQRSLVPASPAAMVVSQAGELVYLGPYSAGGACVSSLGGFVESSLRMASGTNGDPWVNRAAIGCYCDWRDHEKKQV